MRYLDSTNNNNEFVHVLFSVDSADLQYNVLDVHNCTYTNDTNIKHLQLIKEVDSRVKMTWFRDKNMCVRSRARTKTTILNTVYSKCILRRSLHYTAQP